jgi:hypothetical protein
VRNVLQKPISSHRGANRPGQFIERQGRRGKAINIEFNGALHRGLLRAPGEDDKAHSRIDVR